MYSTKYSGLSILLILALMVSMLAVLVPAAPAQATATGITVIFPTGDNTTSTATQYIKQNGTFTVRYTLNGDGTNSQVVITVYNSTYGTVSQTNLFTVAADNLTHTNNVTLNPVVTAGTYNMKISVDSDTVSATKLNAVVVDNTAPSVSVTLPNSSSCWKANTANTIQWAATDAASTENVMVYAYLSTNSGSSYAYSIISGTPYAQGAQLHSYTAPVVDSTTCKILVYAVDGAGNISDNATSSLFPILNTAPVPVVTAPNGGEIWNGASPQSITGTVTFTGSSFQYLLSLSTDSGSTWSENITPTWVTVSTTSPYTLTYPWTVPNTVRSSTCRIRLLAKDCAANTGTATSTANFRIRDVAAPTVTVTAPTTGQTWYAGATDNITWTQTDNVIGNLASTQLWYTTDGGANWYLIGAGTVTQGSNWYTWTKPLISSANCKIKIIATDAETPTGNVTTAYSGTFTISSGGVPTVILCTPNGGESWEVGSIQNITWTASDSLDATARMTYVIQLSTNSGGAWSTIATLSNQTQASSCGGSYAWAVSDSACTTAMIKITATNAAGSSASDQSNAVFTITTPSCAVETGTVALTSGWNLISLPLWPTSTNIDTLLSSQMANVISVWYYTGGGSGSWLSYAPGAPSTLTTLEGGKAYWVNVNTGGPFTLSFQGRKCPCPPASPTTITVSTAGWNMIGFKSSTPKAVSSYFTSLGTCGTAYLAPINGYTSGAWSSVNCSENMTSGRGYWVYINSTGIINPGCE